jgi:predicted transglutaminase-like cysteine proteinase
MFQKIKHETPAIAGFWSKIATVATVLIASCLLPCATNAGLGDPREFKATAEQASFEILTAAEVQFLALSQQLNTGLEGASSDMRVVALVVLISPPLEFKAVLRPTGVGISSVVPAEPSNAWAVRRPIAHQIDADKPSLEALPRRPTFYGAPRGLEASVTRINFETPSLAPMSFVRFCVQFPQDCKSSGIAFRPRPVELTKARIAELARVNREVNRAIRPKANANGVLAEEWLISPSEGDCKDYAVTKRHELLALGWPSRSLLLTEVVVASGEHHVVLVVRARENDLVLDNLNWNVRPVSQIGYQWVRAQQASNPKFWSTISVARSARVAMNSH